MARRRRRQHPKHTKLLRESRHLYEAMLKAQGGRCALCRRTPEEVYKTPRRFDMDHNHKTMKIRGLLCVPCNRAVRDWMTVEWARNLAKYLKKAGE